MWPFDKKKTLHIRIKQGENGKFWFTGSIDGKQIIQKVPPGAVSAKRAESHARLLENCKVEVEIERV